MAPTLLDGDEVTVVAPRTPIRRGELVLVEDGDVTLMRRVVALAGETIVIVDCVVFVDDVVLDEPYLDPTAVAADDCGGDIAPATVGSEAVYVLRDNRAGSLDSRTLGPVPLTSVTEVVECVD